MNFPPFFARYPCVDSADESVDGGFVDEIGDDDRVSFFDRLLLNRWGGIFRLIRFWVLIGFVVRLVWRG